MTLAGAAHAQLGQSNQNQSQFSVKVGGFFPSTASASHNSGSTVLSAGLDYAIPSMGQGSTTSLPSVYFDYNGGSKNGGHVDTYGLGVAVRSSAVPSNPASKAGLQPYVGLGVGYYDVMVKNTRVNPSVSGTKATFGGKIFVGVNLTSNFFVEANYQLISSVKSVNPSGFGAQVGVRF
jgi:hypothetical protein